MVLILNLFLGAAASGQVIARREECSGEGRVDQQGTGTLLCQSNRKGEDRQLLAPRTTTAKQQKSASAGKL